MSVAPDRTAPKRICGALAEFDDVDQLLAACKKIRDAGFVKWDTHSPFPVHGVDEAMGTIVGNPVPSPVPHRPPAYIAARPCSTCQPLPVGSRNGSCHTSMRWNPRVPR